MTVSSDWQFEIRSTVFGCGSNSVHVAPDSIGGLDNPDPKSSDVDLWGQDGVVGNPEYPGARVITIPVVVVASSPANAMSAWNTLRIAWARATSDIVLTVQLPGWDVFTVSGRPRGSKLDLQKLKFGILEALLRFDALDPTITFL